METALYVIGWVCAALAFIIASNVVIDWLEDRRLRRIARKRLADNVAPIVLVPPEREP